MKNPFAIGPGDQVTRVGQVFGTPLIVKGLSWLPVIELITWLAMAWQAGKRRPQRSWLERAGVAALTMPAILGSEWCHNLAHAAAARAIGKPMDAMRIAWGMPLCVYYDINDASVTPRQHILRSLGGPLFNLLALGIAVVVRTLTRTGSTEREVADVVVGMNAFLSGVSLLPLPGIDGGPILKWMLVEKGHSVEQADAIVQRANGPLAAALSLGSFLASRKRRWLAGGFLALLAGTAFGIAKGFIKEQ
jgi:Zn-dependent protease